MIETRPILVVSDLQICFEHPRALSFCKYVAKHYKIPTENIWNVGDEIDALHGGLWKKDINGHHTANSEIEETRKRLKPWYDAFPKMNLATSNHGTRWQRKALESDIPSILLRRYEEILQSPPGWRWQKRWVVKTRHPFVVEHGDRFGGSYPHVQAALTNNMSTCLGHFHSIAGIEYIKTIDAADGCPDQVGVNLWGMATGCLIDFKEYAFHYARDAKRKPVLGVGVVANRGRQPMWIPLE